jgi:hypothetical protein
MMAACLGLTFVLHSRHEKAHESPEDDGEDFDDGGGDTSEPEDKTRSDDLARYPRTPVMTRRIVGPHPSPEIG